MTVNHRVYSESGLILRPEVGVTDGSPWYADKCRLLSLLTAFDVGAVLPSSWAAPFSVFGLATLITAKLLADSIQRRSGHLQVLRADLMFWHGHSGQAENIQQTSLCQYR